MSQIFNNLNSLAGRLFVNCLLLVALTTIVILYFEFIAPYVSAHLKLMVSVGLLPLCIGVISALIIRGSYVAKGVLAALVFPFSILVLRFLIDTGPSRDEEPGVLIFIYTLGATGFTVIVVVFMYFIVVVLRERHLSNKSDESE